MYIADGKAYDVCYLLSLSRSRHQLARHPLSQMRKLALTHTPDPIQHMRWAINDKN